MPCRFRSAGPAVALLLVPLASCGWLGRTPAPAEPERQVPIRFEDVAAADVAAFEGQATIAAPDAGGGLWVALPGLARPERGLVRAPDTGAGVMVALFRGTGGRAVVSAEAAELLGLAGRDRAEIAVVAVRSEARIVPPAGR